MKLKHWNTCWEEISTSSEKIYLCRESDGSVGIDDPVDVFLVEVTLWGMYW